MAKKYIEAELLKGYMYTGLTGNDLYKPHGIDNFVNDLPAADAVEVRHGHWRILYEANPYDLEAECSVCHNEVKMPTCMGKPIYSYCPHCAAKMDEVEE